MKITQTTDQTHQQLRDDIRLLGNILGKVITAQVGQQCFATIENIRHLAKQAVGGEQIDQASLQQLITLLEQLPNETLLTISRSFNQFLNLANVAENYHRIRRINWHRLHSEQQQHQPGSLTAVIPQLLRSAASAEELYQAVTKLDIGLVFTAHPTEIKRRSIMHKYNKIWSYLRELDLLECGSAASSANVLSAASSANVDASTTSGASVDSTERARITQDLEAEITAIWLTPELRAAKPTAFDEAKWGFAVIESELWQAIPAFMRELDSLIQQTTGKYLPIECMPFSFGSWMGGDRDGNPNVTANVTKRVCLMARWVAADLLWREIAWLSNELSITAEDPKLSAEVDNIFANSVQANQLNRPLNSGLAVNSALARQSKRREPYRVVLNQLKIVLSKARNGLRAAIIYGKPLSKVAQLSAAEVLTPLLLCYNSLTAVGAELVARGKLLDVIRQVRCFGVSLVKLDIRQDAGKHAQLMSEITRGLQIGDYAEWSELERRQFLITELSSARQLPLTKFKFSSKVKEIWKTFLVLAELPADSLEKYIISQASQPSDVLLVVLLQQLAGVENLLPVVPLFETLDDLEFAPKCIDELLNISCYRQLIANKQEIMIGYSDSVKDAGLVAASWAQYGAQEQLVKIGDKYGVNISFFHGRGGSISRGGWPTNVAIKSQPPDSIRNTLRVTQQGEVIYNRFGTVEIAKRTMSLYLTAVLEATFVPAVTIKPVWRALMTDLARVSSKEYRDIINSADFSKYFAVATPVHELNKLAIGSRPQRRSNQGGLQTLRAIPWVFAWTQNRLLLPSWLGLGAALTYALNTQRAAELTEMLAEWPFFYSMTNMGEMVLAKADPNISAHYEARLVSKELEALGESLRAKFRATEQVLRTITKQEDLLSSNSVLSASIRARNPYILPLHIIQVELLRRSRRSDLANKIVDQALLISVAGIAAGMRNTG